MKLPEQGELWSPTPGELTAQGLDDYRTSLELAGFEVPNLNGTEIEFRLSAVEKMLAPVWYNQAVKADSSDERFTTGDQLDSIRERLMLPVIPATPSEGPVSVKIVGTTPLTFPDGMEGKLKTGQVIKVKGNHFGVVNNGRVTVTSVSLGSATNSPAGTPGKWTAPPLNVGTEFVVADNGLVDGGDEESDAEKSERIQLKRLSRANVSAENWGALGQIAREAHPSIQAAFVYPCLGGPASGKVVVVGKQYQTNAYSREVSDSILSKVYNHVRAKFFSMSEIMVQTANEVKVELSIGLTFAQNRSLWMGDKWPRPTAISKFVRTSGVTDTRNIRFAKADLLSSTPTAGSTIFVSWWCKSKKKLVTTRAVFGGDYDVNNVKITTDIPLSVDGVNVLVGDVIFPSPNNAESYVAELDDIFYRMGPGENTSSPTSLNENPQRGYRLPRPNDMYPYTFDVNSAAKFRTKFQEISNCSIIDITPYSTPAIPGSPNTMPNMLQLDAIGIYPES